MSYQDLSSLQRDLVFTTPFVTVGQPLCPCGICFWLCYNWKVSLLLKYHFLRTKVKVHEDWGNPEIPFKLFFSGICPDLRLRALTGQHQGGRIKTPPQNGSWLRMCHPHSKKESETWLWAVIQLVPFLSHRISILAKSNIYSSSFHGLYLGRITGL